MRPVIHIQHSATFAFGEFDVLSDIWAIGGHLTCDLDLWPFDFDHCSVSSV